MYNEEYEYKCGQTYEHNLLKLTDVVLYKYILVININNVSNINELLYIHCSIICNIH